MLYLADFRADNDRKGWSNTEIITRGAHSWNSLSTHQKLPYMKKSDKLKEKYELAIKKYSVSWDFTDFIIKANAWSV